MATKWPAMTLEKEAELWEKKVLTMDTSIGLTRAVVFYIIKCFGIWQGKHMKNLTTKHLGFGEDNFGKFVFLDLSFLPRTRNTRRYDSPDNPRSVYKIFKKFSSYVANEGPLLIRPISSIKDHICYSPRPLGVQFLDQTVQTMMEDCEGKALFSNVSVSLLAIDILKLFGCCTHGMTKFISRLYPMYSKTIEDVYRACSNLNCENRHDQVRVLISNILDPPYPEDSHIKREISDIIHDNNLIISNLIQNENNQVRTSKEHHSVAHQTEPRSTTEDLDSPEIKIEIDTFDDQVQNSESHLQIQNCKTSEQNSNEYHNIACEANTCSKSKIDYPRKRNEFSSKYEHDENEESKNKSKKCYGKDILTKKCKSKEISDNVDEDILNSLNRNVDTDNIRNNSSETLSCFSSLDTNNIESSSSNLFPGMGIAKIKTEPVDEFEEIHEQFQNDTESPNIHDISNIKEECLSETEENDQYSVSNLNLDVLKNSSKPLTINEKVKTHNQNQQFKKNDSKMPVLNLNSISSKPPVDFGPPVLSPQAKQYSSKKNFEDKLELNLEEKYDGSTSRNDHDGMGEVLVNLNLISDELDSSTCIENNLLETELSNQTINLKEDSEINQIEKKQNELLSKLSFCETGINIKPKNVDLCIESKSNMCSNFFPSTSGYKHEDAHKPEKKLINLSKSQSSLSTKKSFNRRKCFKLKLKSKQLLLNRQRKFSSKNNPHKNKSQSLDFQFNPPSCISNSNSEPEISKSLPLVDQLSKQNDNNCVYHYDRSFQNNTAVHALRINSKSSSSREIKFKDLPIQPSNSNKYVSNSDQDMPLIGRVTSEINLGDYFPPGTMIPASGITLVTQQSTTGNELLLKFDYQNK